MHTQRMKPNKAKNFLDRADCHRKMNQLDLERRDLKAALGLEPKNADIRERLYQSLIRQNRYAEAETYAPQGQFIDIFVRAIISM